MWGCKWGGDLCDRVFVDVGYPDKAGAINAEQAMDFVMGAHLMVTEARLGEGSYFAKCFSHAFGSNKAGSLCCEHKERGGWKAGLLSEILVGASVRDRPTLWVAETQWKKGRGKGCGRR